MTTFQGIFQVLLTPESGNTAYKSWVKESLTSSIICKQNKNVENQNAWCQSPFLNHFEAQINII
jgi:hypothetical protein